MGPVLALATLLAAASALGAQNTPVQGGAAPPAGAQRAAVVPLGKSVLNSLEWRLVGPANMSGRVSDVVGIPGPSRTFFVASAAGGIFKTTNNGTTFRPVFEKERVVSMGVLAIAPSDTMQVWAGTGEPNSRNSMSPGGGVYKSVDGGLTWKSTGLEKTQTVGRIVVHPTNPDIVYVAALGAPWSSNPERGLYKTEDGGKTWKLSKFISDKAGFVDVAMDPRNPNVLWASSYERYRNSYSMNSGGPGSALWKTTDAGGAWTEVKGGGLPETMKGRISIAISLSNPDVMYSVVEAAKDKDAKVQSGLYRSEDSGKTWAHMNNNNERPFYYSQVRIDPKNPNRVYWSSTPVNFSDDGGKTVRTATNGIHVDHHGMWIDPNDANRIVVGNDGGVAITYDKGGNYNFLNTLPLGQAYEVSFDMAVPYNVCSGFQDNGTWCGPSRRSRGSITNAMWFNAGGGDGFYTAMDPRNPNIVYSESQGGSAGRRDLATGESRNFAKPMFRDCSGSANVACATYRSWEDSIVIVQGDLTKPLTADEKRKIDGFRSRQVQDSIELDLRYNWNAPYILSPHNPDVVYFAGNRLLKSTNRGDNFTLISPDLSTHDTMRIRVSTTTTGGITPDVTGAETYSTIVAVAESPLMKGMLFVGTDDGNVWLSHNDGGTWTDLTPKFKGMIPSKPFVARIEPSAHDMNTFWVAFDAHRDGDYKPYLFATTDGGKTFKSIAHNLPSDGIDFLHVIRQDLVNPDLLFVGTDVGAYVSLDRGASWQKFMNGLPTVPVHDLKIHPREHELIAATHGHAINIVDIAPLQQMRSTMIAAVEPTLFAPPTAFEYSDRTYEGQDTGHQYFSTPSPAFGADIVFYNPTQTPGGRIVIQNAKGDTIQSLPAPAAAGIQRVTWNLRPRVVPVRTPLSPSERRDSMQTERRITVVSDSLIKAGKDSALVGRAVAQLRGQGGGQNVGGRQGGGGGNPGAGGGARRGFVERPGEANAGRGQGAGPAGGQAGGQNEDLQTVLTAFRDAGVRALPTGNRAGGGGGGGGGGGAAGGMVEPGEYDVTLLLGDKVLKQKIKVERPRGTGNPGAPPGMEEDH
ncbi:MAG: hypothetical protein ABIV28_02570 [Longimicrobiales bacterium]